MSTELKIEYLPTSALKPYEKNARKHKKLDVDNIAKSIKKYGMNDAIGIWGKDNIIVEGHGRLQACKKLGIDTVPVVRLDHLTNDERREYAIAHNATAELSEWDLDILGEELAEIDLSGFDFDFGIDEPAEELDDLEERERIFKERMASGEISEEDEEYQEFLQKFELKKTTDDCYTPAIVYDAVADYVAKKYNLDNKNFLRPFYPGGDYQSEKYKPTDVVVDNPPFSIIAEILKFYNDNNIKFFLFAPHLTVFSSSSSAFASCIICGVTVTYENKANVATSFITNLENCAFRSSPTLFRKVKQANDENLRQQRKELPKYSYPLSVVTSNMLTAYSRCGIDFEVGKDECYFIRQLDDQKKSKKALYGAGYLISERKKAEREKAEREKVEKWELSEREKMIIKTLK